MKKETKKKFIKCLNNFLNIIKNNKIIFILSCIIFIAVLSIIIIFKITNNKKTEEYIITELYLTSSFSLNNDLDNCVSDKEEEFNNYISSYKNSSVIFDKCSTYILKVKCDNLDEDNCKLYLEEIQEKLKPKLEEYKVEYKDPFLKEEETVIKVENNSNKNNNKDNNNLNDSQNNNNSNNNSNNFEENNNSENNNNNNTNNDNNKDDNNNNNSSSKKNKCKASFKYEVTEKVVTKGYYDNVNVTFSASGSYLSDECYITHKSSNTDVAVIDSDGMIQTKNLGKTYIYVCANDVETKEQISCYKGTLIVEKPYGEQCEEKSLNFANLVDGYYWYLDNYEHAYIHTSIKDWYDHTLLDFQTENMGLKGDKFVMAEDTNIRDYDAENNLHNHLFFNPTELGCSTIDKYKMNVSGDKLYITIGGKKYSFTKYTSKKKSGVTVSVDTDGLVMDEGTDKSVNIILKNTFFHHDITSTESVVSIAACNPVSSYSESGTIKLNCHAYNPGTVTITVKDTVGGSSETFNITVNDLIIPVTGVSLDKTELNLEKGGSSKLNATVNPFNADNKNIKWTSSNTSVATVDRNGIVKAEGKGNAVITATTSDGSFKANCNVTVINPKLTASASVGLTYSCTNSGCGSYTFVDIKAQGGTGIYTYLYKVYYNDTLIGTYTLPETYLPYQKGTYMVEYTVSDSSGETITGTSTMSIS